MRIKVDYGDGAIGSIHAAEQRKRDSMITAEGYYARQSLAMLGRSDLPCVGSRCAHEDAVVAFFDLLDGPSIVVPNVYQLMAVYSGH